MKMSEAKKALKRKIFDLVEIRKNPVKLEEHIVLLHCYDGKSFILAYENGSVLSTTDLTHMTLMLKEIGFKKAKIYF